MDKGAWLATVRGVAESYRSEQLTLHVMYLLSYFKSALIKDNYDKCGQEQVKSKLLKPKNSSVSSQWTSGLGLLELYQNSSKTLLQLKTERDNMHIYLKMPP